MKIICAWCRELIGYKCPLCGAPLKQDPANKSRLICDSKGTPIHFTTENMQESHGICTKCRSKITEEDAANITLQVEAKRCP